MGTQPHRWHTHLGRSHQSLILGDASPRGAGEEGEVDSPPCLVPSLCQGAWGHTALSLECPTSSALPSGPCRMEPGHPGPIKHRDPQPQDSWCRYSQLLLVQAQREAPPGEGKRQAVGQHHPTQWGAGVRLPHSLLLAQLLGGVRAPGPHPGGCHLLCWWLQLLLNAHVNLGCIQWPLALRLGTLGTESPADLCGHHCATVVPEVPLSEPSIPSSP